VDPLTAYLWRKYLQLQEENLPNGGYLNALHVMGYTPYGIPTGCNRDVFMKGSPPPKGRIAGTVLARMPAITIEGETFGGYEVEEILIQLEEDCE
jgi:hypothetical protein